MRRSVPAPLAARRAVRRRRQPHLEPRPLPELARHLDPAAVVLGDVLHDRQAEPRPAGLARPRAVDPVEAFEDPGRSRLGIPRPVSTIARTTSPSSLVSSTSTWPPAACSGSRCRPGSARAARGRVRSRARAGCLPPAPRAPRPPRRPAPRTARPRRGRSRRARPTRQARSRIRAGQVEQVRDDPDRRAASRSSCEANRGITEGSSPAAVRIVSAAAWIEAAGVFSSCEAFATKSRRTWSSRRVSVMSRDHQHHRAIVGRSCEAPEHARWRTGLGLGHHDRAVLGCSPGDALEPQRQQGVDRPGSAAKLTFSG
jgi:hypothetical protein